MKRILSTLLALCMVLSLIVAVPLTASAETTGADMSKVGYKAEKATVTVPDEGVYSYVSDIANAESATAEKYVVGSTDDLERLAFLVSNGVTFEGKTIYLVCDIDFSEANPAGADDVAKSTFGGIGTLDHPFMGTFDGQGYSISNITLTNTSSSTLGLFGCVKNATIKNLQLLSPNANKTHGKAYDMITCDANTQGIGALAGRVLGSATFDNIYSSYGVAFSHKGSFGGFVGYVGTLNQANAGEVVTFTNCTNAGQVLTWNARNFQGGMVGDVNTATLVMENCINTAKVGAPNDTVMNDYMGGLVGFVRGTSPSVTLTNCVNSGDVWGAAWFGGVVGTSTAANGTTLIDCTNNGKIVSTVKTARNDKSIGGVIGQITGKAVLTNCINNATVTGFKSAGIAGVIGNVYGGGPTLITNCTNNGAVTSPENGGSRVAGIVGEAQGAGSIIQNCTNNAPITAPGALQVAGIVAWLNGGDTTKGIINCTNTANGTVKALEGGQQVAGIVGLVNNSARIEGCTNLASVEVTAKGTAVGTIETVLDTSNAFVNTVGGFQISGVIAVVGGGIATVVDCKNAGNISGNGWHKSLGIGMGGVLGSAQGTYATLSNCANSGNITAISNRDRVGGIVGNLVGAESSTVTNCVNSGVITGNSHIGGITGYTQPNAGKSTTHASCTNYGAVNATGNAGGIIGAGCIGVTIQDSVNKGSIKGGANTAGIIGLKATASDPLTVTGCSNFGVITTSNTSPVEAGIFATNGGASTTTLTNNVNYGPATAQWEGYQIREANGDVRLVGSIDHINYSCVGFEITIAYGGQTYTYDAVLRKAYTSLLADDGIVEAPEYRGADARLFALVIEDVPAEGEITISVKTFSVVNHGEARIYGETAEIVLNAAA